MPRVNHFNLKQMRQIKTHMAEDSVLLSALSQTYRQFPGLGLAYDRLNLAHYAMLGALKEIEDELKSSE